VAGSPAKTTSRTFASTVWRLMGLVRCRLGLDPFHDRLEAGPAEIVEDQPGLVLALFEQQEAKRAQRSQDSVPLLPLPWQGFGILGSAGC
jgi:hypothetical protein